MSNNKPVVDFAVFKLPHTREYQFAAMTNIQAWVRAYRQNTYINDMPYAADGNAHEYQMAYALDTDEETLNWWMHRGAFTAIDKTGRVPHLLSRVPAHIQPTIVFDFTEERITQFDQASRHVCQAYTAITGAACAEKLPSGALRIIQMPGLVYPHDAPNLESPYRWAAFDGILASTTWHTPPTDEMMEKLLHANMLGVIGYASWQTYYMATFGYAVIEVLPKGRHRAWMPKWENPLYRCIEEQHLCAATIEAAQKSIESTCQIILARRQTPVLT